MFGSLRKRTPATRRVTCPECGAEQELDKGVFSAVCKRCHGRLSVEEAGAPGRTGRLAVFASSAPPMTSMTCPHCGHETVVPEAAINAKCTHCHELFPVRKSAKAAAAKARGTRLAGARARMVHCYKCRAQMTVAREALSTMCPKCGQRVELRDIEITAKRHEDLSTCGRLHVTTDGMVVGRINAAEVLVEGVVRGQVVCDSALVVGATGRCHGEVVAKALRVAKGAVFACTVRLNEELLETP